MPKVPFVTLVVLLVSLLLLLATLCAHTNWPEGLLFLSHSYFFVVSKTRQTIRIYDNKKEKKKKEEGDNKLS